MTKNSQPTGDMPADTAPSSDLRARFARTLPLWPVGDDGRCTCAEHPHCTRPGKHPASDAPGPGYAVLTGAASGLFVVDPDVKGGVNGINQLEQFLGGLPKDTLTVVTPSGGLHFYHAHPGFPVHGHKFASAVDIKGDGELVYVVGPGSPGFTKTKDPCVVEPGIAYTALEADAPISAAPTKLLSWLRIGESRSEGFAPEPVDVDSDEGRRRVQLGIEACKTMPPSMADGEGGKRLLNLAIVLVRRYELPHEVALDLVLEHFNPRCTQSDGTTPFPWSLEDVEHKLEDAAEKSSIPTGIPSRATTEGFKALAARFSPEARHARALERLEAGKNSREFPEILEPHAYDVEFGKGAKRTTEKIGRDELINILAGLDDAKWIDVLRFDVLRGGVSARRPPIKLDAETSTFSEEDAERVSYWLACIRGKSAAPDVILRVVTAIASTRPFNPLVERFRAMPPSTGAIDELCDLLGAEDALSRTYVRKFMLAAVRRASRPGCKSDSILGLRGLPGAGKSSFVQALFGEEWASESLPSLGNTKAVGEAMASKWCVELAELAEMFRVERDTTTAFIPRLVDRYRPAYGRGNAKDHPRMCVLVATLNGHDVYSDVHGADIRRIWVLDVPATIDTAKVREIAGAVWSEAYAATAEDVWNGSMLVKGEPHWLVGEEQIDHAARAENFQESDEWERPFAKWLGGKTETDVGAALVGALGMSIKDVGKRERNRAAKVFRMLKCTERRGVIRDGIKCNVWLVPADIADAKPLAKVHALRPR